VYVEWASFVILDFMCDFCSRRNEKKNRVFSSTALSILNFKYVLMLVVTVPI
jgi:hypothetical protein